MSRHVTPSSTPRLSSWKAHIFPVRLLLLLLFTLPIDSLSTKNRKPGTLFIFSRHHRANILFLSGFVVLTCLNQVQQAIGCFFSVQSREQQTLLCKTGGVVLVVVSCLPGFGRLSDSLTLVRQYRSPPLPLFAVKVRDSKEGEKTYLQ